jgi:hypothetical protein
MRSSIVAFSTVAWLAALSFAVALPGGEQARPKLDCRKLALEYATAFENLDFKTVARLEGRPWSEEDESRAKAELKEILSLPDGKAKLAWAMEGEHGITLLRLFPAIAGIPDWATEVVVDYDYIRGNELVRMHGSFEVKEGQWIVVSLRPEEREALDEAKRATFASESSPAPPPGQEALDVGPDIAALIATLTSAVQKKDWDAAEATGAHPDSCGLHPQDPPEEREVALKRLAEFPSIGPIPAPARSFRLRLAGAPDREVIAVDFHWPGKALRLSSVGFR